MIKMAIFTALTLIPISVVAGYSAECTQEHQADNVWIQTNRSCDTIFGGLGFYLYGWPVFSIFLTYEAIDFYKSIEKDAIKHFIMENSIS